MREDPPDRGDLFFHWIIGFTERDHRAGFGHAVADNHLRAIHVGDDLFHHLDRAGRAGHDSGAQRGKVELIEARMRQLGDEHGRHAVQRGTAFLVDRLQNRKWIKRLLRIDQRGAMGENRDVGEHHAKAMIQRYRHTEPVLRREFHPKPGEVAIVENIKMGQRRALGEPCGATGELDVDRVIELERARQTLDALVVTTIGEVGNIGEVEKPGRGLVADLNGAQQVWQPRAFQGTRSAAIDLRRKLSQHCHIVAGFETARQDQCFGANLVQRIFELRDPIGGINVHKDQPGLGGGILRDHPFGIVW